MKTTKFPWWFKHDKTAIFCHVSGYGGQGVATVASGDDCNLDVAINNAKIICGAPEMYALLQKIAKCDSFVYPSGLFMYPEKTMAKEAKLLIRRIEGNRYNRGDLFGRNE